MNLLLDKARQWGAGVAMVASKYFISQGELFALWPSLMELARGVEVCELLKTLLHQVHCHQLGRGRVWAVPVTSGPWNHALACHLSGKWLLADIPSRLKGASLIRT